MSRIGHKHYSVTPLRGFTLHPVGMVPKVKIPYCGLSSQIIVSHFELGVVVWVLNCGWFGDILPLESRMWIEIHGFF